MVDVTKAQIPWRGERGPSLYSALFRCALAHGIHLKKTKEGVLKTAKIGDRWNNFLQLLFKQPEFHGLFGSVKCIRDQYDKILNNRSAHHGWKDENGGVTGNLSDHQGDLDPIDECVKIILMEMEQEKSEDELIAGQRKRLDRNECDVLMNGLGSSNTIRTAVPGVIASPIQRLDVIDNQILQLLSSGGSSTSVSSITINEESENKRLKASKESKVESEILEQLSRNNITTAQFVSACGISGDLIPLIDEISIPVLINIFSCSEFDSSNSSDYFKHEAGEYGIMKLPAHKIFLYLKKMYAKLFHYNSFNAMIY